MDLIKTVAILAVGAFVLTACGDDGGGNHGPAATAAPIFCKSPVDNSFVPKEQAVAQAKAILAQKKSLALADTATNVINVSCGDTVVVVAPPGSEVVE